jgi:polar amino acid transport system substrate-binding protein
MLGLRSLVASSILLAISAGVAHAQEPRCEPDKVAQKYPTYAGKVVKIAATPGGPPYAFADPQNPDRMAGLEVEMIEKAMVCAGLKFEYMRGAWSGLLTALFSGSGDVMIGAVNYRPDRAERADFALYMRVGQSVIVQKGNPKKLGDLGTLCGMTASATVGGSSSQLIERQSKTCVEQGKPAIQFLPAADSDAAYRQLSNQRIDFVMDDAVTAAAHAAKQPEIEVAHTATSDILSGMVVKKGNAEMLQIVADGLKVEERDGTITTIAKKYDFPANLLIPIQTRQ